MVITNFAAGELSENLFGRNDLPQYFQGAARLENFDVIPSGGIEKRRGTRRILSGLGNGRIFPFIISRDEVYLLYFTHQQITVYRAGQWNAPAAVFTNADVFTGIYPETLYTDEEIPRVQHAQNYNIQILVQENHRPLAITRTAENTLSITVFDIIKQVTIEAPDSISKELFYEQDQTYASYLTSANNYPRAVTFMNGRLLFAGTKETPQRIFASRVNAIHDFSTYKKYLTEKREYVVIQYANINFGDNTLTVSNPAEITKFIRSYEQYYIDLPRFFDEGTMIADVIGDKIYLTKAAKKLSFSQQAINNLITWKNQKEAADYRHGPYLIRDNPNAGSVGGGLYEHFYCYVYFPGRA